jgi:glycosyltransferase involved in cell wall biosynthesis
MHIGYFTNSYLPVINGVVRSVSAFRRALMDLGHNVFVFAQEDDYQDEEAFVFRYPSIPLPVSVDIPAVIPISPCMDSIIPALKLDLFHVHHPILLGQTAANKAEELNLPLVFTFHTQYREYTHYVPFPQEIVQDFLKERINNWLMDFMRRCQHIIVPSESMLQILVREYGLESHYTVIPTGIDLDPFQDADGERIRRQHTWENDRVMISIGRLAKEKNWELLLQAASQVINEFPDLRVVLLGDGPEREALTRLAAKLGIRERVNFMGEIPFEEIPAYLKAADFFGFSSTTETQGLVTMEAMAAGLPIVAVDASGTRDIVQNGVQGLLVEAHPHALAEGIHQLLSDRQCLENYSQASIQRSKTFEIHNLAKKILRVYERAIQDKADHQYVQIRES